METPQTTQPNKVIPRSSEQVREDYHKELKKVEAALEQCTYAMKEAEILVEEPFVQDNAVLRRKANKVTNMLAEIYQELGVYRFRPEPEVNDHMRGSRG